MQRLEIYKLIYKVMVISPKRRIYRDGRATYSRAQPYIICDAKIGSYMILHMAWSHIRAGKTEVTVHTTTNSQ